MTFEQRRNRLTTLLSERIPVVKRRMALERHFQKVSERTRKSKAYIFQCDVYLLQTQKRKLLVPYIVRLPFWFHRHVRFIQRHISTAISICYMHSLLPPDGLHFPSRASISHWSEFNSWNHTNTQNHYLWSV